MEPFTLLPAELRLVVLRHFDRPDLLQSALISRAWRDYARSDLRYYLPVRITEFILMQPVERRTNMIQRISYALSNGVRLSVSVQLWLSFARRDLQTKQDAMKILLGLLIPARPVIVQLNIHVAQYIVPLLHQLLSAQGAWPCLRIFRFSSAAHRVLDNHHPPTLPLQIFGDCAPGLTFVALESIWTEVDDIPMAFGRVTGLKVTLEELSAPVTLTIGQAFPRLTKLKVDMQKTTPMDTRVSLMGGRFPGLQLTISYAMYLQDYTSSLLDQAQYIELETPTGRDHDAEWTERIRVISALPSGPLVVNIQLQDGRGTIGRSVSGTWKLSCTHIETGCTRTSLDIGTLGDLTHKLLAVGCCERVLHLSIQSDLFPAVLHVGTWDALRELDIVLKSDWLTWPKAHGRQFSGIAPALSSVRFIATWMPHSVSIAVLENLTITLGITNATVHLEFHGVAILGDRALIQSSFASITEAVLDQGKSKPRVQAASWFVDEILM
ncbi:hypothetical protein BKA62DRAFT_50846 [Auriculariales sp. MPI-PUGE-AT-0066]|nr:hypothetical protein BKA62DRAFT_50846 [Auriculariales sp. MPI-PUGE-AT-0066]